jgi:hypothetical protein
LDKDTREIKNKSSYLIAEERALFEEKARMPEEEVDPLVFEEKETSVKVGANVKIGEDVCMDECRMNVDVDFERSLDSVPEHDDIVYTPEEWSPAPSPRLEPFANNDVPLIELPCVPTHIPLLPPQNVGEDTADDPPDSPPSESLFPVFPGTFPVEPNDTPNRQNPDFQARISTTIQATLDALARLGHLTINGAQNTGFPVVAASSFENAHRTIDANAQIARANLESARTNLQSQLEQARIRLQSSLASATTNIDSARTGINSSLTTVLSSASTALTNATKKV